MGGSTLNTGIGSAQKALNRDVFAAYIYLLVLTQETGRLFQKLGSKTRSNCESDRSEERMYEAGKKIDKTNLSAGGQARQVGHRGCGIPILADAQNTAGIYPQTPHLTWKPLLP